MITCPECQKEIADDSAHCGYCGAEIRPVTGSKTMFGMGAVTAEDMEQAAEEARQKGAASRAGGADAEADASSGKLELPKPGLPKPGLPKADGPKAELPKLGLPKPGLPKPGLPKPGLPKADGPRPLAVPKPDAPVDSQEEDEELPETQMMPSIDARVSEEDDREPSEPIDVDAGEPSEPLRAPEGETTPAMTGAPDRAEPWLEPEAALGPGPEAMPQGAPGGPVMAAQPKHGMHVAGAGVDAAAVEAAAPRRERNKKLILLGIAIAGLVAMGCVGAMIWGVFTFLF